MRDAAAANWAGNVRFGAARVVAPESVGELQEIVAGSRKARALGTGHSFSRIADTDGTLIATARLPRRIQIDDGSVTVSGGIRYGDLARELAPNGWALRNLGSLPHISVAGACATGTHGSGDRNGSLATSVAALELVTASGELVSVRRGDEDFDGHVIALGALGVTVAVTLDLVPGFQVRQLVYEGLTRDTLLESVQEIFAASYSVSVFTGWDPESSQLWLKQRVDGPGDDGEPPAERFGARLATRPLHPVPGIDPTHTTQQLGVPGPWHERLPHFRLDFTPSAGDELQTEYFVAREHAAAAIEALFAIGAVVRPALQISEIRTVAADALWLSPAYRRDVMALHFTWISAEGTVMPAVAAVERALAPFDPVPHWGKVFALPPAAVRAGYPRAAEFLALAARRDPEAVFRNQYLDAYLPAA
ncbi:FAD-binding protein [Pseudofrankia inefficax]|uniref:FAD linked oxidase domain protein n=1 Tax=Pseudofrankia inefficax (strain DSM 45817 / CECT 9037 / DDB 130130 / EuI1c) TaxID=298654 RepID=E3IZN5_PSEI1|nr:FAD-binding protein [Pseudofrankia inefficax]ADP83953.1 FAD linked oxidase domain protein [Pseudofrankia inefficax]